MLKQLGESKKVWFKSFNVMPILPVKQLDRMVKKNYFSQSQIDV
jgi:hypothetical protein